MKTSLIVVAALSALAAAFVGSTRVLAASTTPRQDVLYGHIKSLKRVGGRYEMRFDPALFLQGTAAERAAVEDKAIQAGEPVPNDYYIVDEGHRLLSFVVAAKAPVTVLTRQGNANRNGATAITVSELAQLLAGKDPNHRQLTQPKAATGYVSPRSTRTPRSRSTSSTSRRVTS
jgi:hypothetical protein